MNSWIQMLVDLPLPVSILLKITLVIGVGWMLHLILVRCNPRWRVLLWRGVVAGVVLVPILVPLKYLQVPVTPPPEPAERTVIPQPLVQAELPEFETFDSSREIINTSPLPPFPDSQPQSHSISDPPFSIPTWARQNLWTIIVFGWGFITLLITARFLTVLIKIRKRVKSSLPAPIRLQHLLDEVAVDLNCSQKITLRCSPDFTSPFLAGLTRPVIILPERMLNPIYANELPAIFAHEIAHLRAKDLFWMFAARWLSTALWFHPLVWKLRDAHNAACEEVCDAVAADYVGNPESYSSTLARIALAIVGRVPAVAGIPMARSSEIIGRLRILKRKVYSSAPARRWVALSLLVGCVALATIGGLTLVHAESPHNSQPAEIASAGVGGVAKQVKDGPVGHSATRVINFPKDRVVGGLYTADVVCPAERPFPGAEPRDWLFGPVFGPVDNCRPLGQAQGEVRVPADKMIRLDLAPGAWKDGQVFAGLKPDDIQILWLPDADDSTMQDVGRLTGLEALSLLKPHVWDDVIDGRGLRHLTGLKKLKCLLLPGEISSEDLAHITELPLLKYLYFCGPMVNDDKVEPIGKMTSLEELYLLDSEVGQGLKHLAGLKSLRRLSLRGNKSKSQDLDQGMAYLTGLTELEELNLQETLAGDAGLAHLKGLNKLKRLYLQKLDTTGREITDKGMAHLSGLQALEKLVLPFGVITDEGLAHLSRSDSLKELHVYGDGITYKGLELISGMKSLQKLDIGVNKDITDADMATLARCTGLKELDLRHCAVTDAGFAQLKSLKSLKKLTIRNIKITGEGLAVLRHLPLLTELKLVSMTLGENGLAHLEGVTSLERLHLAQVGINIGDDELKHIGTLTNLKRLDIFPKANDPRQPFTDRGFSHLSRLTALQWLRLGGNNNITNDAFKHLGKLTALEGLELSQCEKISDAALKHLEGLTSLRFVVLGDSRVTEAAMARLKKKIPKLHYGVYSSGPPADSGYGGQRKPQRRPPRSRR